MPNARLVTLPDIGQLPLEEALALLRAFLDRGSLGWTSIDFNQ